MRHLRIIRVKTTVRAIRRYIRAFKVMIVARVLELLAFSKGY